MTDQTITTAKRSTASHERDDASIVSLRALGWILRDEARASRFLALTGLDPEDLRERIADPALHGAVVAYLAGHEADLIACAADIAVAPEAIQVAARALRA